MENKKSNKGLVIFLIIVVLVLFAACALLFTGIIKSPFVKETSSKTDKTKTSETKVDTKTKTAEERYKEYLNNLAKSIETKYEDFVDMEHNSLSEEIRFKVLDDTGSYSVSINKNKELILSDWTNEGSKYHNHKIADNVVSVYRIHIGNGGYSSIFYITTEGKVYSANVEISINKNEDITVSEIENVKNIIEIREGSGTNATIPIYIDIDGNMYTPNVVE